MVFTFCLVFSRPSLGAVFFVSNSCLARFLRPYAPLMISKYQSITISLYLASVIESNLFIMIANYKGMLWTL